MALTQFKKDLQKGHRAEEIVIEKLKEVLNENFSIEDVSKQKEYFYNIKTNLFYP